MRILCSLSYSLKVPTRLYVPLLNYFYEEATIGEVFPKELLNYCFYHTIKSNSLPKQTSTGSAAVRHRCSNFTAPSTPPRFP
jgi:hypothetical protein